MLVEMKRLLLVVFLSHALISQCCSGDHQGKDLNNETKYLTNRSSSSMVESNVSAESSCSSSTKRQLYINSSIRSITSRPSLIESSASQSQTDQKLELDNLSPKLYREIKSSYNQLENSSKTSSLTSSSLIVSSPKSSISSYLRMSSNQNSNRNQAGGQSENNKGFLFIPLDQSSVTKSKKPVHLDRRISTRNQSQPNNQSGSSNATSPTRSSVGGKISPTSMKKKIDAAHKKAQERRGNILETRRQTLAAKSEAIEEQVKATEQRLQSANEKRRQEIESNLQAAEKSRNEILQGVVSHASSVVKKAKQTAHDHDLRSKSQIASKREHINRKLNEVSARRKTLLKIPRSKLLEVEDAAVVYNSELGNVPDEAATVIQTSWRSRKFRSLVSSYNQSGLLLESVGNMQFDELAGILSSQQVIANVNALLDACKSASPVPIKIKNGARIFLTAFVIVCHADAILMEMNEKEQHLQTVARDMLIAFETWLGCFRQNQGHVALQNFLLAWQMYHRSFESWKTKDRTKYINQLVENFLDLERLWRSVQVQVDADTQWRPKIDQEKARLRRELGKIGGASAIDELNKRIEKLQNEEPVPMEISNDVSEDVKTISQSPSNIHLPVTEFREQISTPKVVRSNVESNSASVSASASNVPNPIQSLGSLAAGTTLSNEVLAHELMLDPTFEIQNFSPDKQNPQLKQIREAAKRAFFDNVREDMSKGKQDYWLPLLLGDIKSQLLAMLANENGGVARHINEVLDLDFIKQQIQNKVFALDKCFMFVIGMMKKLCAPVRDEAIREIEALAATINVNTLTIPKQRRGSSNGSPTSPSSAPADIITVLERILALLDEMKMDLANFRLMQLRPVLKEHIVSYEREKFQQHLNRQEITLEHTTNWIRPAVEQVRQVADERNPENIDSDDNKPKYLEVYSEALMGLLTSADQIGSSKPLAETLRLDGARLLSFQNEIQALTIVSALNMLLRNSFPLYRRDVQAQDRLRESILVLLTDPATKLEHLQAHVVESIRKVREARAEIAQNPDLAVIKPDEVVMLNTLVDKTLSTKDKVFSLLQRRIASVIKTHLVFGKFKPENLPRHGLDLVGKELALLSERIFRFSQHNRDVYAPFYDKILKDQI